MKIDEIPSGSVGSGIGNELTLSSKNNSCLYQNRDVFNKELVLIV